jgi:ankyrin repeat protein
MIKQTDEGKEMSFSHGEIIKQMQSLGYRGNDRGLCHGLASMWIQSLLSGEKDKYFKHIERICTTYNLAEKIAQAQAKKNKNLTKEDEELLDVLIFLNGVEIYQNIAINDTDKKYDYRGFSFGRRFKQGRDLATNLMASKKIEERGGIVPIGHDDLLVNEEELDQYFNQLRHLLIDLNKAQQNLPLDKQRQIAIRLGHPGCHSIDLHYDVNTSQWEIVDANKLIFPGYTASPGELLHKIKKSLLSESDFSAITVELFTTADYPDLKKVKESFAMLKDSRLITPEIVSRKTKSNLTLPLMAAMSNDDLLLKEILEDKKSARFLDENDLVLKAVQYNCPNALEELIKSGVDVTQSINGEQIACYAAKHDSVEVLQLLKKYNIDFNKVDSSGYSPLMWASMNGNVASVKKLLEKEFNTNLNHANTHALTALSGKTAVHFAALFDHPEVLEILAENHADLTTEAHDSNPPALQAVYGKSPKCLEILAKYGVDIGKQATNGITPLMLACHKGDKEIVNLLVKDDYKLDLNQKSNKDDTCAIHVAIENDHFEILEILAKHKANLTIEKANSWSPVLIAAKKDNPRCLEILVKHGVDLNTPNSVGETPLMIASRHNHKDKSTLDFILKNVRKENINLESNGGSTAVHFAVHNNNCDGIEFLEKHGANFTVLSKKESPAIIAARKGYVDSIQKLIDFKMDIETPDADIDGGWTPALVAADNGNAAILEVLAKNKINLSKPNRDGFLPSHYAARRGDKASIEILAEYKADLSSPTKDGMTPAHYAAKEGRPAIIQALAKHTANLAGVNNVGKTPLHIAAESGFLNVVKRLLESNVNIDVKTNNGKTALDLAKESKRDEVVAYLQNLYIKLSDDPSAEQLFVGDFIPLTLLNGSDDLASISGSMLKKWQDMSDEQIIILLSEIINRLSTDACERFLNLLAFDKIVKNVALVIGKIFNLVTDKDKKTIWVMKKLDVLDYSELAKVYKQIPVSEWKAMDSSQDVRVGYKSIKILHNAVLNKDCKTVELILGSNDFNVNSKDSSGNACVHIAIINNDVEMLELLLKNKADLAIETSDAYTSALLAAKHGNIKILELLEKKGIDLGKAASDGWYPLMVAVRFKQLDVIKFLCKKINVNQKFSHHSTALHLAMETNYAESVDVLVAHGANLTAEDSEKYTPALIAAHRDNLKSLTTLASCGVDLSKSGSDGWTPLITAASRGGNEVVEYLLKEHKNIDVNSRLSNGSTSAYHAAKNNKPKTVSLLAKLGADLTLPGPEGSPASVAAINGHSEVIQELINHKVSMETPDGINLRGLTPGMHAAMKDQMSVIRVLIKNNVNLNIANHDKLLPSHLAAREGNDAIIHLLGEAKADLRSADKDGSTPAHYAALRIGSAALNALRKYNVDLNCLDNAGKTPLHIACENGNYFNVTVLIEAGVRVNIKDKDGKSALDLAVVNNKNSVADYLKKLYVPASELKSEPYYLGDFVPLSLLNNSEVKDLSDDIKSSWMHLSAYYKMTVLSSIINLLSLDSFAAFYPFVKGSLGFSNAEYIGIVFDSISEKSKKEAWIKAVFNNLNYDEKMLALKKIPFSEWKLIDELQPTGLLQQAASRRDRSTLVSLVEQGHLDVNKQDADGKTVMHVASELNAFNIIEFLAEHNAKLTVETSDSWTPALRAAQKGNIEAIETLAKLGVDLDQPVTDGYTPLMLAAIYNHVDLVKLLIQKYKVNINRQEFFGRSALYFSIEHNHESMLDVLLDAGAALTSSGKQVSPVCMAAKKGYIDLLMKCIRSNADVETPDNSDAGGWTPALWAAFNNNRGMLIRLAARGVNFSIPNREGKLPSHIAAEKGHEELIDVLANSNADLSSPDKNGMSPAHYAVKFNQLGVLKKLIIYDVNLEGVNNEGKSLLRLAIDNGNENIIHHLIEMGDRKNKNGKTLLELAQESNDKVVTSYMENRFVDLTLENTKKKYFLGNYIPWSLMRVSDLDIMPKNIKSNWNNLSSEEMLVILPAIINRLPLQSVPRFLNLGASMFDSILRSDLLSAKLIRGLGDKSKISLWMRKKLSYAANFDREEISAHLRTSLFHSRLSHEDESRKSLQIKYAQVEVIPQQFPLTVVPRLVRGIQ